VDAGAAVRGGGGDANASFDAATSGAAGGEPLDGAGAPALDAAFAAETDPSSLAYGAAGDGGGEQPYEAGAEASPEGWGAAAGDAVFAELPQEAEPLASDATADADLGGAAPAGWDVAPAAAEPPASPVLGEYDETASGPAVLAPEPEGAAAPPLDAVPSPLAPGVEGYAALGDYDDTAGFAATYPDAGDLDDSAFLAARGLPAEPGAEWAPETALEAGFELESGGSFEPGAPAPQPSVVAGWDAAAPLAEAAPARAADAVLGETALWDEARPEAPPEAAEGAPLVEAEPGAYAGGELVEPFEAAPPLETGAPPPELDFSGAYLAAEEPASEAEGPLPDGAALAPLPATDPLDAAAEDAFGAAGAEPSFDVAIDAEALAEEDIPTIEGEDILEEIPAEEIPVDDVAEAAPPLAFDGTPEPEPAPPPPDAGATEAAAEAVHADREVEPEPLAEAEPARAAEPSADEAVEPAVAASAPRELPAVPELPVEPDAEPAEPEPAPQAEPPAAPACVVAGVHRVVVHTMEGQVRRGILADADLAAGALALAPQPGGPPEAIETGKVKAIFFMLSAGEQAPVPEGKKVRVTFRDGRQVAGFSPDYSDEGVGFFMVPGDTRTNTGRIWVYRAAVRQVSVS
jgi:hypothetical protein